MAAAVDLVLLRFYFHVCPIRAPVAAPVAKAKKEREKTREKRRGTVVAREFQNDSHQRTRDPGEVFGFDI